MDRYEYRAGKHDRDMQKALAKANVKASLAELNKR
jgi:hypothetical protein